MHVHPFCGLHEMSFPKVDTFGKPWGVFRWFAMFFFWGGEGPSGWATTFYPLKKQNPGLQIAIPSD